MTVPVPVWMPLPGFTEAVDISDPLPSAAPLHILHQVAGYATPGAPGTDPSADVRSGMIWTKRYGPAASYDNLAQLYQLKYSQCLGLNGQPTHSHIVGWASDVANEVHAALFEHQGMTLLRGLNAPGVLQGAPMGQARSVTNPDNAQLIYACGWSHDGGLRRPVRWTIDLNAQQPPRAHTIVPIATEGEAHRIDSSGAVVGWMRSASGMPHAFRWMPGGPGATPPNPSLLDLGTLGGARSVAYGLAGPGVIVGVSDTLNGESQAFLWQEGWTDGVAGNPQMKALGVTGPSAALDVNTDRVVVGWALDGNGKKQAVLWSGIYQVALEDELVLYQNGIPIQLNGGWVLTCANSINNRGHIVGIGLDENGKPAGWRVNHGRVPARRLAAVEPAYVFRVLGQVAADGGGALVPLFGIPVPIRVPPGPPPFRGVEKPTADLHNATLTTAGYREAVRRLLAALDGLR